MTPDEFLADSALGRAVFDRLRELLAVHEDVTVRTTKSQIAFARRRGFAYLWLPGNYLRRPQAEVVLSILLGRRLASPRFTEVAHPSPTAWQHHLEVAAPEDLDAEVAGWLRAAYADAA